MTGENSNKSVLVFGEVLYDTFFKNGVEARSVLGGAPANFAFHLTKNLGVPTTLISNVGVDPRGTSAHELLKSAGISTRFLGNHALPTGDVTVNLLEGEDHTFTIHPNMAYDHIPLSPELLEQAAESSMIYFGTLAQRSEVSRETLRAILSSAPSSIPRFCDINLRKDCFSAESIEASLKAATILKLNEKEIIDVSDLLGFSAPCKQEASEFFKELQQRYAVETVIVTAAEHGARVFSANEQVFRHPGYKAQFVDAVGAGDAFSAGFISKFLKGEPLDACLDFGNRMGALVASRPGAMCEVTPSMLQGLVQQERVPAISETPVNLNRNQGLTP